MISFSTRALLPGGLLVGLSSGCVHQSGTRLPSLPPLSTVTAEDIPRAPDRSIDQMLMGRFPGVAVTTIAGGGISVLIRGTSSFYSNNEPLYVLDGMPIQPGPHGSITWLNPYDIASIDVLKDPAETAIYGVLGANGVIVIQTKPPGRPRR